MIQIDFTKEMKKRYKRLCIGEDIYHFLEDETVKDYVQLCKQENSEEEIIKNFFAIYNKNIKKFVLGYYDLDASIYYLSNYLMNLLGDNDSFNALKMLADLLESVQIKLSYNDIEYMMRNVPYLKETYDVACKHKDFNNLLLNNSIVFAIYTYNSIEYNLKNDTLKKNVDALTIYVNDISTMNPVDSEMEKLLISRIKMGDTQALNILIERNLKLVLGFVRKYNNDKEKELDLIQEGALGLYDAISNFDNSIGNRFSTYAVWHIRKKIMYFLETNLYGVNVKRRDGEVLSKVKKAQRDAGCELTIKELCEATGLSEYVVTKTLKQPSFVSLEAITDSRYWLGEKGDYLTYEDELFPNETKEEIMKLLENCDLTEQEIYVLKARKGFIDGKLMTCKVIGEQLSVSPQRVSKIEIIAIDKIRRYIIDNYSDLFNGKSVERLKLLVNKRDNLKK